MASMGSYHYTDMVAVFCDDDFFPHNHDVTNGHNDGGYVESTVPDFKVYSAGNANFVLVLDISGSMNGCNRMDNLKSTLKRWVDNLKSGTKVAIVKFGDNNVCATGSKTIDEKCYVKISNTNDGEAEKKQLMTAIDQMDAD